MISKPSFVQDRFIEVYLTSFLDAVGLKIQSTISMAMRSISEKDAISGRRLKFIYITLFENKTLAAKRPQVTYLGSTTMHELIGSFF